MECRGPAWCSRSEASNGCSSWRHWFEPDGRRSERDAERPDRSRVLAGTLLHSGSADPVSRPLRQTSPCPLALRRLAADGRACAAMAGARQVSALSISAQSEPANAMVRVSGRTRAARDALGPVARHRSLFARATRTSVGGLRSSIPASQVPGRADAWQCCLMMTLLAPMISSSRKERSPIRCPAGHCRTQCPERVVVAPGPRLPPVECCLGARPSVTPPRSPGPCGKVQAAAQAWRWPWQSAGRCRGVRDGPRQRQILRWRF